MEGQELSKKERKELRRQEKREGIGRARRLRATKKLGGWAIGIAAVAGAGWLGMQALTPKPLGQDYSMEIPYAGATHVAQGTRVEYQSNPPTSGNHWPDPLRDGIYDEEKPDEAIVHSLEHGRVWVSYRSDLNSEIVQALEKLLAGRFGVILTPRSANETDIALAAWTRLDTFDLPKDGTLETKRISNFISRYLNKGPEYVPQSTGKTYE